MKEEMRTIGYLCPACHKRVIQQRSVFALSASGAVVSCECGESSLTIAAKMLCCFIGEDYAVEHEMEQLSLAAAKEREQGADPAAFADSVIMYEILSEPKEIAARKDGITCSCGSKSYGMEIHSTYVDLVCKSCGAKLRIPAATDEDLDRRCCRMKLQIKSE